jgi:hypothetical protein
VVVRSWTKCGCSLCPLPAQVNGSGQLNGRAVLRTYGHGDVVYSSYHPWHLSSAVVTNWGLGWHCLIRTGIGTMSQGCADYTSAHNPVGWSTALALSTTAGKILNRLVLSVRFSHMERAACHCNCGLAGCSNLWRICSGLHTDYGLFQLNQ